MKKMMMMAALVAGLFCFSATASAQEKVQTNVKLKKPTAAEKAMDKEEKAAERTVTPVRSRASVRGVRPQRPDGSRVQRQPVGADMKKAEAPEPKKKDDSTRPALEPVK